MICEPIGQICSINEDWRVSNVYVFILSIPFPTTFLYFRYEEKWKPAIKEYVKSKKDGKPYGSRWRDFYHYKMRMMTNLKYYNFLALCAKNPSPCGGWGTEQQMAFGQSLWEADDRMAACAHASIVIIPTL